MPQEMETLTTPKTPSISSCRVGLKVYARVEEARKFVRSRGVPRRYQDATLKDFPEKQLYHEDLSGKSFYIHGPVGCGKTHLLCALLREASYGVSSRFISSDELLQLIKDSFNQRSVPSWEREEEEAHSGVILDYLCEIEILALDDLGAERITKWSAATIGYIINRRYNDMKPTYISSNLDLNELSEQFDARISSRLSQMCICIHLDGSDRRIC